MRTTEVESIWMNKRNISVLTTQLTLQYVMKMTYTQYEPKPKLITNRTK